MEVHAMKRLFPFVFVMFGTLLSIALLTAYRSGLLAKVAEVARERIETEVDGTPEAV
jgi:hypothetical protein